MKNSVEIVAGVDVGTECVKALIMTGDRAIVGRAIVPTRGRFETCVETALKSALAEAGATRNDLDVICATGFGARCVPGATRTASDGLCHGLGAAMHTPKPATVIDMGGYEPVIIHIEPDGRPREIRAARRCAAGVGTFLMFAARHLDVHPTLLEELAAGADEPAFIGSYCSVFAGMEILERLAEGATPESVALGCINSIAERISEIGELREPVAVTGGVPEYFPGVLSALSEMTHVELNVVPEPIMAGALGAAITALDTAGTRVSAD